MTKLHLFDLDDTLIVGYMSRPDKDFAAVELLPGRYERWAQIRQATGNQMAIVTNQGGVAFGYQGEADVQRKFCTVAAQLNYGELRLYDGSPAPRLFSTGPGVRPGTLTIFVCYYDVRGKFPYNDRTQAHRRKPSPTMIGEAMDVYGTVHMLFVGDRDEDEQAARAAGIKFRWAERFFSVSGGSI
jgi:histidinol phosphatase-like enzyme